VILCLCGGFEVLLTLLGISALVRWIRKRKVSDG